MKTIRHICLLGLFALLLSSCSLFNKNKSGCGTNGKNVGAEKLLSEPDKKQPKFKA